MQFRVLNGDISEWNTDGIIYSASSTLLPTSPVSRELHQKGGLSFSASCRHIGMCHVGHAVMTRGFQLKASFVIHAVGPYWAGGKREEEESLLSACREALSLAREKGLKELALAPLSSADKGYPLQRAAAAVVPLLLTEGEGFDRLDIVCADSEEQAAYTKSAVFYWLQELSEASSDERGDLASKVSTALALLQSREGTPDPIALSGKVKIVDSLIQPFLQWERPSLADIEQTASKIRALYSEKSRERGVAHGSDHRNS
ncbi:macro domain-containing protein [uncultured Megasphaera sp.]|uniref:macro domain-containing protein n=1 Tax=uncultured Megasphaera sp. TaxID=165188 RepID=UPI0025DF3C49|nr:macro domain-containing protein [uncultured Megasphaera sp.]